MWFFRTLQFLHITFHASPQGTLLESDFIFHTRYSPPLTNQSPSHQTPLPINYPHLSIRFEHPQLWASAKFSNFAFSNLSTCVQFARKLGFWLRALSRGSYGDLKTVLHQNIVNVVCLVKRFQIRSKPSGGGAIRPSAHPLCTFCRLYVYFPHPPLLSVSLALFLSFSSVVRFSFPVFHSGYF